MLFHFLHDLWKTFSVPLFVFKPQSRDGLLHVLLAKLSAAYNLSNQLVLARRWSNTGV